MRSKVRQRTLYALMGLGVAGMVLGVVLGVAGVDPASHWVFSASLLALLALGVVWGIRAWRRPENRPLLRLMCIAVAGIVAGWIVGEAGATAVAAPLTFGFMIALIAFLVAFAVKARRAVD